MKMIDEKCCWCKMQFENDCDIIEEDFNLYCFDCYDNQIEADIINNQIEDNK